VKLAKGTTKLWVAERRGRVVYTRTGKPTAPGVPKARELATEEAARAFLEKERDKRLREGFEMVDEAAGLDTPFTLTGKPRARTIPARHRDLADEVKMHVRGGFQSGEEIDARIEEMVADRLRSGVAERTASRRARMTLDERLKDEGYHTDDPSDSRSKLLELLLDLARSERVTVTKETPPDGCLNEAIDRAFAALHAQGIIALQAAGYTQSDGWDDAREIAMSWERTGRSARGACFYHEQDLARAVRGGGLMLSFGSFRGEDDTLGVGREIVRVLGEHGVPTEWTEDAKKRIGIPPFPWHRRPAK
jgi:hypothetical protein